MRNRLALVALFAFAGCYFDFGVQGLSTTYVAKNQATLGGPPEMKGFDVSFMFSVGPVFPSSKAVLMPGYGYTSTEASAEDASGEATARAGHHLASVRVDVPVGKRRSDAHYAGLYLPIGAAIGKGSLRHHAGLFTDSGSAGVHTVYGGVGFGLTVAEDVKHFTANLVAVYRHSGNNDVGSFDGLGGGLHITFTTGLIKGND